MTKIDIYSGFLGAGKTTLIRKMIRECFQGEKLVLIENEFGQIGIDSDFLQDSGIQITEMNSGCICCSLVGDFGKALQQVIAQYCPDRIIIEPSGVGKLSDVVAAVEKVTNGGVALGCKVAVADVSKVKVYMRNFGEFYNNQIENADAILLSRTDSAPQQKLDAALELLRQHNAQATIITTPWDQLTGAQILEAMEGKNTLADVLAQLEKEHHDHEEGHCCHGHHDHDHEEGHCCHGHHDHDHEEGHCCHGHHDHDHEEGHCCHGHHEHHHHENGHCSCGHDHHDHHADEVFTPWGVETVNQYTQDKLAQILKELESERYGMILRAKGIVPAQDGSWLHFDYVPGEAEVRKGTAAVTGKICVIGANLDEKAVAGLFGV